MNPTPSAVTPYIADVSDHAYDRWRQRFPKRHSIADAVRRAVPVKACVLRAEAKAAGETFKLDPRGTVFMRDAASEAVFVCRACEVWYKPGGLKVVTVVRWKCRGGDDGSGGTTTA